MLTRSAAATVPTPATGSGETRLAVIGPSFFSYIPAIVDEFRRRGIRSAAFDERHSNRIADKILYRLGAYHLPLSPKDRHLARLRQTLVEHRYTDVLLVDVEVVDRAFVRWLRERGVQVHLYMWDAARNKPRFTTYLDALDSRGSFDPRDCADLGMDYIPLFGEALFDGTATGPAEYDIGFCGTVHSSRTAIMQRLRSADWSAGLRLKLMLYYHSRALFAIKGIRDRAVWPLLPLVQDRSFAKQDIAAMYARTKFVLDIPHPGQTGMTARTFEALLAGARLLTFNRNAAELLPASLQRRITVIDDIEELARIDFAGVDRLDELSAEESYHLSLRRFVDQLADMMGLAPAVPLEVAAPETVS